MFALAVRFDLRDEEAAAQFDDLTRKLVEQVTAHEPGAVLYVAHTVADAPLARLFYEVYANEEAFRTHGDREYVKAFFAARAPLLSGRKAERLAPFAAKGLPAPNS